MRIGEVVDIGYREGGPIQKPVPQREPVAKPLEEVVTEKEPEKVSA